MQMNSSVQKEENVKQSFQETVFLFIDRISQNKHRLGVHQEIIRFLGDPEMALFFSQLLYWADKTKNPDHLIYKSDREWGEELGLSKYTVRKAREYLEGLGIIETKLKRANGHATTHYKVNFQELKTALENFVQGKNVQNNVVRKAAPKAPTETKLKDSKDRSRDDNPCTHDSHHNKLVTAEDYVFKYNTSGNHCNLLDLMDHLPGTANKEHLRISEWSKQEGQLLFCSDGKATFKIDNRSFYAMLRHYFIMKYDDPDAHTIQYFNRPEVKYSLYKEVMKESIQKQHEEIKEETNVSE